MRLTYTEVDGIPAVWTEGGGGPTTLGIMFRVGRADENLARGGITHLVEHLALHSLGQPGSDFHHQGVTTSLTTTFVTRGDPEDTSRFISGVCAGLRDLPTDRIDAERFVLHAEAATRSRGIAQLLAQRRYGPASFGLPGYPEHGLDHHTRDDVVAWVTRWFTRANAVLFSVGGPPPEGLRVDLRPGTRVPPPEATSAVARLPAYFSADVNGVAGDAVLPRSAAAVLYAAILNRRLWASLREQEALSYAPAAEYERRDARYAVVTALADAAPDRRDRVAGPLVDTLIDLATVGAGEEELDAVRSRAQQALGDPGAAAARALSAANDLLVGAPPQAPEEASAQLAAVTATEVRNVAAEALRSALVVVPLGQAIGQAGFREALSPPSTPVSGRHGILINQGEDRRLIVGETGVSLTDVQQIATVRFDECAAMMSYPDGGRVLVGADGTTIPIEPTLWSLPAAVLTGVDDKLPADRIVHLPARDPDSVPSPPPPPPAAMADRRHDPRRWFLLAVVILWIAASVVIAIVDERAAPAVLVPLIVMAVILRRRP